MSLSERILTVVNGAKSPVSAKQLAYLGLRNAIDQALSRLVKRGQIVRHSRGKYEKVTKRIVASSLQTQTAMGAFIKPGFAPRFERIIARVRDTGSLKLAELITNVIEHREKQTDFTALGKILSRAERQKLRDCLIYLPDWVIYRIRLWVT